MTSNEEEFLQLKLRMIEYEKNQKEQCMAIGKEYKKILEEYLEKLNLTLNVLLAVRTHCTSLLEKLAKIPSKLHFKRNIMIAGLIVSSFYLILSILVVKKRELSIPLKN